jgi:hypothetical protein
MRQRKLRCVVETAVSNFGASFHLFLPKRFDYGEPVQSYFGTGGAAESLEKILILNNFQIKPNAE